MIGCARTPPAGCRTRWGTRRSRPAPASRRRPARASTSASWVSVPSSSSSFPFRCRYQRRKSLRCCLKFGIGIASTQVYAAIRYHHMTPLLHRQRASQTLRCYAALVSGRRGKVGIGNSSCPTYVRSSYKVGKTWMHGRPTKEYKCIIIIIDSKCL